MIMNKVFLAAAVVVLMALSGCARPVHKDPVALGGSKSDATVRIGIVWNPDREIPETTPGAALALAEAKCRAWGYEGAEAFGGVEQKCVNEFFNGYGMQCVQMQAVAEFQCLGGAPSPLKPASAAKNVQP